MRARQIQTPTQLLRVVLLFAALDYSERSIAANLLLVAPRLERLSNQAVRERLAACLPWLQAVLPQLMERPALPPPPPPHKRLLALEAAEICAPGTTGTWCWHARLDVARKRLLQALSTIVIRWLQPRLAPTPSGAGGGIL